jgi:hypothetical protein
MDYVTRAGFRKGVHQRELLQQQVPLIHFAKGPCESPTGEQACGPAGRLRLTG